MKKSYLYIGLLTIIALFTTLIIQGQIKEDKPAFKKPAPDKLVSAGQWKEIRTIKGTQNLLRSLAFSPDNKTIVSAGDEKVVKITDYANGLELNRLVGHKDKIWSVAYRPDGKFIASAGDDRTVKFWDPDKNKPLLDLKCQAEIWAIAFSPNSKMLAAGDTRCMITLYDIPAGLTKNGQLNVKEIKTFQGHSGDVFGLAFSPDNKLLASGSHDYTVKIWDIESGKCLQTLTGHKHLTFAIAFSPNGQMVASGSFDMTVKLWDVKTGEEIRTLQGHLGQIRAIAFSPDGSILASGSEDGTVKIWETSTGRRLQNMESHVPSWVHGLSFSPNGKWLASSDYSIKIWEFVAPK